MRAMIMFSSETVKIALDDCVLGMMNCYPTAIIHINC